MLQNATPLRKSAPGPPNSSDEHVSCTAPATENASLQIFFKWPTPAIVLGHATKPSRFAHFDKVHSPLRLPREMTSERPKVAQTCGVFNILTSKCASRHNGVHFFDIATSKSAPKLKCFAHFDFEMCFAPQCRALFIISTSKSDPPQRHALFRHHNFQKWSQPGVFCTYWLSNVLRAATACNFSSRILLFDFSEQQTIGKNTVFRDFPTFLRACIFFLLTFSLLWSSLFCSSLLWLFPPLLFHLSILSEVWLLNFLRRKQIQLQLRYITKHYTTLITLHFTTATTTTATTTALHYTTPHHTTLHYTALLVVHLNNNCNCNYITLITPHYSYNSTTPQLQLQLQLQLHHAILHPAVVVRWALQPLQPLQKTQLQLPFGPSVGSLCHPWFTTTNLSYRFPIFETSATALCCTTGIKRTGKQFHGTQFQYLCLLLKSLFLLYASTTVTLLGPCLLTVCQM